jgi:hypothetical protein
MMPAGGGYSNQQSASSGASTGAQTLAGTLNSSGWTVSTGNSRAGPDSITSMIPWIAAGFAVLAWFKFGKRKG